MNARTGAARARSATEAARPALAWPGDPEAVTPADVDFTALAHVLANCCRRGGRMRRFHSLAAHAVIVSEEIQALDGLGETERRTLALHALLAGAASAWFRGEWTGSARAAERTARLASGIERSVREAAGLEPVLDEDRAELLRFVARMASAAESRDLLGNDAPAGEGVAFAPLKRRIRSIPPDRAAEAWLARFRSLGGDLDGAKPGGGSGVGGARDA